MHKGKIGWQPLIAATQFNSRRITILWVNIVCVDVENFEYNPKEEGLLRREETRRNLFAVAQHLRK